MCECVPLRGLASPEHRFLCPQPPALLSAARYTSAVARLLGARSCGSTEGLLPEPAAGG